MDTLTAVETVTYAVETMNSAIDEMMQLFDAHWREIALNQDKVPLDIDLPRYRKLEEEGSLHLVTVRCDGVLIGYYVGIVSTHLHYKSTLMGFTDIYYIRPDYRKGFIGIRMFKFVEKTMKARGVKVLTAGMKLHHDNAALFEFLRWNEIERTYQKVLE